METNEIKILLGEPEMTNAEVDALMRKAKAKAINHYFWHPEDNPDFEAREDFLERYEYEIVDVAKAIIASDARGGLVQHTELGITDNWGKTGVSSIDESLNEIPRKTYVM